LALVIAYPRSFSAPFAVLFIAALPFAYYPKLFPTDTQLWPLLTSLLVLAMSRQSRQLTQGDIALLLLAAGAFCSSLYRLGFSEGLLRFSYKLLAFTVLWIVVPRLQEDLLARGMKLLIFLWFIVGASQSLLVLLGLEVDIPGRYVPGRSGVPSLAPEPSLYGLISVLALHFLLLSRQPVSPVYTLMAFANVILSGSVLAGMMAGFLLFAFGWRGRLLAGLGLFAIALLLITSTELPLLGRLQAVLGNLGNGQFLLSDFSINQRLGHLFFTLWFGLPQALLMTDQSSFQEAYNAWAASGALFYPSNSDFILTSAGEMIFLGGIFGLLILVSLLGASYRIGGPMPLLRVIVVAFAMLTQLGISSVFLMIYALGSRRS